jgi:hypothetical protein
MNEHEPLDDKLLRTEKALSTILHDVSDLRSKSKEIFIRDYETRLTNLEKMLANLSKSLEYYKKKYEHYYTASKKLSELLSKQDKLIQESGATEKGELLSKIRTTEENLKKILIEYSGLKKKYDAEIKAKEGSNSQKLIEEAKHYYEKSKFFRKRYEYYFSAAKALSQELLDRERNQQDGAVKKELEFTRNRLKDILSDAEMSKELARREVKSKYKDLISESNRKLEYYMIVAKSSQDKSKKYQMLSKKLVDKLKATEEELKNMKKLVSAMERKLYDQTLFYTDKLDRAALGHKRQIETITKAHLQREIGLNARISSLKKDFEKYYHLYNQEKLEKTKAFEEAKKYFESKS